jgi:hypothetical protein
VTPERSAASALRRLLGVGLALAAAGGVHRLVRVDRARDPVGAVRAATLRYPMLRADVPVDRLGPPCDAGDGTACTDLGLALADARASVGLPLPSCLEEGLFMRGCDGDDWRACDRLVQGSGECGAPDADRVQAVLEGACDRLVFAACDALARARASR